MLQSMTGFASASFTLRDTHYIMELKTLNSKGLEFIYKTPSLYRNLEIQIKSQIQKQLERGKIELSINTRDGKKGIFGISEQQFAQQYSFFQNLSQSVNAAVEVFPLVVQHYNNLSDTEELNEEEIMEITTLIHNLSQHLIQYRLEEGKSIEKDIINWIETIETQKNTIATIEPERIQVRREKLLQGLKELSLSQEIDYNRLGQEVIYYIEKLDISEEISRLTQHIQLFKTNLAENSTGKKLGFIAQEIGREINTIGSKANDSEIQHRVVDMKDQLERIKEQLNNVL